MKKLALLTKANKQKRNKSMDIIAKHLTEMEMEKVTVQTFLF